MARRPQMKTISWQAVCTILKRGQSTVAGRIEDSIQDYVRVISVGSTNKTAAGNYVLPFVPEPQIKNAE